MSVEQQPVFVNPRDPDLLAGTAYRMCGGRPLGMGSTSIVVEAEHKGLRTRVVVKMLHPEVARCADLVDRLRMEAQALSRLRSPHIPGCTDLSVTPGGVPFLVMERFHGATVADELARRELSHDEVLDIAMQTLAGLSVVHEAGMVHRDIKPANLFLCREDPRDGRRTLKILDFGIVKVLDGAPSETTPPPLRFPTSEGDTIGTPTCLSPEQARGLRVDARTDLYAVGVLLYRCLAGRGPFDDLGSFVRVLAAHALEIPRPPSAWAPRPIPAELDDVVMRALAKRPEDRFASAAEFHATLAHVRGALRDRTSVFAVRSRPETWTAQPRLDTIQLDGDSSPWGRPSRAHVRFETELMPETAEARSRGTVLPPGGAPAPVAHREIAPVGAPLPREPTRAALMARAYRIGVAIWLTVVVLGALFAAVLAWQHIV